MAPLLWATNFVLAKVLLRSIGPGAITVVRWAVAAALIGPLYVRAVRRGAPWWDWRVALMGLLGVNGFTTLLYAGLRTTSAVDGSLLYATTPVFAMLGEWFVFREPVGWRRLAGLVASLLGVAAVVGGGRLDMSRVGAGDALVLAAVLCWAGYTVLGRTLPARLQPLEATGGAVLFGLVSLLPWWPGAVQTHWSPASLAGAVYLGVFPSVLAYALWLKGVQSLGAASTAMVGNLLPFFTALLAGPLLGEAVTPADWAGGALICGGVMLVSAGRSRTAAARAAS